MHTGCFNKFDKLPFHREAPGAFLKPWSVVQLTILICTYFSEIQSFEHAEIVGLYIIRRICR